MIIQNMHDYIGGALRQRLEAHRIRVMPQYLVLPYKPEVPAALIRILSASEAFEPLDHPKAYAEIAEFQFDDADSGPAAVTPEQACAIVDFFERNADKYFCVHCAAGYSRSPAVAAAFAYFKGDHDAECDIFNIYRSLNRKVYRSIIDEVDRRHFDSLGEAKL